MYIPDETILKKYADILVKFALHSGQGVKPGEVVMGVVPDVAKPMYGALQQSILEAGAMPLLRLIPTGFDRQFYELANDAQLTFFPEQYLKARVDLIDHQIGILAEHDLHELQQVPPEKIIKAAESKKKIRDWMNDKEYQGNLTWTLALYGTEAMAAEVNLSLKEYWQEIINACFLDYDDPIAQWRKIFDETNRIVTKLNSLNIDTLQVEADHINLTLKLGEKRRFVAGMGRNIPSFEIFTSPDWRGTQGTIRFNQPLYRYGQLIEGVELQFKDGVVVKSSATKGESLLTQMLQRPNADKVGEFSLTDARFSRITHFMANTLYDENRGGEQGNTHIAIGMSYKDAYDGDPQQVPAKEWENLGFVDSGEHCDIVDTTRRTVTAIRKNGDKTVIYKGGQFQI